MTINSRAHALRVLGLSMSASEDEIKIAYKNWCKMLHPDTTGEGIPSEQYYLVVEAYEYLVRTNNQVIQPVRGNRVLGSDTEVLQRAATRRQFQEEKARQEKNLQKKKQLEKQQFEAAQQKRKQDEEYKKAMEAINAIRAAKAIEAALERMKDK